MPSNYPAAPDNFPVIHQDDVDELILALYVNRLEEALNALQGELGNVPSGAFASVRARLDDLAVNATMPGGALAGEVLLENPTLGKVWRRPLGWFDVVEKYGAVGNGTDNQAPAIQEAIDDCEAAGGGIVYFPKGNYRITSTLNVPIGVPIILRGTGPMTKTWYGSRITKASAGTVAIQCLGTGPSAMGSMCLEDLDVYGSGQAGTLVRTTWTENNYIRRCRFWGTTSHALHATTWWNAGAHMMYISNSGGPSVPAMVLDGDPANAAGGTHTVHFTQCEWEGNQGTDIYMTGDSVTNQPCTAVDFTGCKSERASGTASHPLVHIGYCNSVTFANFHFGLRVGTGPLILQDGTAAWLSSAFVNCHFGIGGAWAGNYHIDHFRGAMLLSNCKFFGSPAIANLRISATVPPDGVAISNMWSSINAAVAPSSGIRINDGRTGTRAGMGSGGGYRRELYNDGNITTTGIATGATGTVATLTVTGAALGDFCRVALTSSQNAALRFSAQVTATNTVTVYASNNSAGTVSPTAGLVRVLVETLT